VLLDLPSGLRVTARLDGSELPSDGAEVSLSVTGPALAFPAGSPIAAVVPGELTGLR
jgi:iron(III) transport system ATP-binding protein